MIDSKIIFALIIFSILIFNTCNDSNLTEVNNTKDQINTWTNVTNGLPISAYTIASIGSNIYVFADYKLYSSSNNGESWKPIGTGLPDSTWVNDIAGINNYIALATDALGVFISNNFGETFVKPISNGLESAYIHSIEMDSEFLFIGAGNYAEVYRSSDLGNNWTPFQDGLPIRTPLYIPRIYLLLKNNNLLFACPFASGIYYSNDNGISWQSMNEGLPYLPHVFSFAVTDLFYFGTVLSEPIDGHGLYRRAINSSNWIKMSNEITDFNPHFVIAKDRTVLVSVDSGIAISFDYGNNWYPCNKGLEDTTDLYFYYAVIHDDYVFAADNYGGIWRYPLK